MDEPQASVLELQERAVRGDALDGAVDDGPDLDLGDAAPSLPGP
jgi:hypothetical protein